MFGALQHVLYRHRFIVSFEPPTSNLSK